MANRPVWTKQDQVIELGKVSAASPLQGHFDARRPDQGLQSVSYTGQMVARHLFCLQPGEPSDWRLNELYLRQPDAIAVYDEHPQDAIRRTLYWRCLQPPAAGTRDDEAEFLQGHQHVIVHFETWLSFSTSLLDTRPYQELQTFFSSSSQEVRLYRASSQQWHEIDNAAPDQTCLTSSNAGGLLLTRCADQLPWLTLAVFPSDFHEVRCERVSEPAADGDTGGGQDPSTHWQCTYVLRTEPLEKGVIRRFRAAAAVLAPQASPADAVAWYEAFTHSALPLTT